MLRTLIKTRGFFIRFLEEPTQAQLPEAAFNMSTMLFIILIMARALGLGLRV